MLSKEEQSGTKQHEEADLILEGGKVLNVYSGEILDSNVTVKGEKILYVGPRSQKEGEGPIRLDVSGKLLVPGYMEPHCHPWNIYNPVSFGEEACRFGTTTLVCDNLFFYMFMGVDLFQEFMEALSAMPIKYFWFVRVIPQTPMEGEEEVFSAANVKKVLRHPLALSIGEITRWKDLVHGEGKILECIRFAGEIRKRVDGHTAGAKLDYLEIISRMGVESCHESISAREALERLRLGFHVMLRESSLRPDLRTLLQMVRDNPSTARRVMLTTDSSTPAFQYQSGMVDRLIGMAIEEGIDPVEAYRMATLNPALYFGLETRLGGIAPGRDADILVLSDLHHPTPEVVISKGRVVAERKALSRPFPDIDLERFFSIPAARIEKSWTAKPDLFDIHCKENRGCRTVPFPVINLTNPVITRVEHVELPVKDGCVDVPAGDGLCRIATINRHGRWVANGIIRNYAHLVEGIASTFNTATEIITMGRSPEAMAAAVNRVLEMGGGIAAVEEGRAVFEFPLPLGGMMSERPMKELAEMDAALQEFLKKRGYPFHDPLYSFIFLPNDFLPDVRINRKGVVDIRRDEILWPARNLKDETS
ncbi:MAG: adenine deaminase [Desulfobacteraceae bacterium]|nr:MAG: adenine deaminase [Desulfobacteraceae bacterium]